MINIVWVFLISIGIIFGLISGNIETINNEIVLSAKSGINLIVDLIPMMVLWCGLMNIASSSGLLNKFARFIKPFLSKIFPTLKNDKALGYIASNIAANMIGLGSAATPFGLKAMEEMQKENPDKTRATDAMITFLVLNTSGVTIIPTTVIALRTATGSSSPSCIILSSLLATILASTAGLFIDYLIRRYHNK